MPTTYAATNLNTIVGPLSWNGAGLPPRANAPAGALLLLERKRLDLARAMATGAKLLLLDEIAGGLTAGECQSLVQTIRETHGEGATIIWIEHVCMR